MNINEKIQQDSNMIFEQIIKDGCKNFDSAENLLLMYALDQTISRDGISNARGRLKKFYDSKLANNHEACHC